MNGIEDFLRRADAIDRSLVVKLPAIPAAMRRAEDEFWKAFRADYPRILGGAYDAVAGGLRELPSVQLAELPRMADFARWGEAVGRGLGWPAGTFTSAYSSNRERANDAILEESLVATALIDLGKRLPEFWGGYDALLRELTEFVEHRDYNSAYVRGYKNASRRRTATSARWPKDSRQLAKELRRVLPLLRQHGITAEFERGNGRSIIKFTCSSPPDDDDDNRASG